MQNQTKKTKLQLLLLCKTLSELENYIRTCDTGKQYSINLPVSWDYWHLGKHAEVANDLGLKELSLLMSAAWQMTSVFNFSAHQQKERAKELKKIRIEFEPLLAVYL